MLRWRSGLSLIDNKLAMSIDGNGHNEINIVYEMKKQKAIEQELGCKLIGINSEKKRFWYFHRELSMKY